MTAIPIKVLVEVGGWRVVALPDHDFGAVYQLEKETDAGWCCWRRPPDRRWLQNRLMLEDEATYGGAQTISDALWDAVADLPEFARDAFDTLSGAEQQAGRHYRHEWRAVLDAYLAEDPKRVRQYAVCSSEDEPEDDEDGDELHAD